MELAKMIVKPQAFHQYRSLGGTNPLAYATSLAAIKANQLGLQGAKVTAIETHQEAYSDDFVFTFHGHKPEKKKSLWDRIRRK